MANNQVDIFKGHPLHWQRVVDGRLKFGEIETVKSLEMAVSCIRWMHSGQEDAETEMNDMLKNEELQYLSLIHI